MAQITVLDSTGATQTVAKVTNTGQSTGANSLPVVLASDQSPGTSILSGSAAQAAVGSVANASPVGPLRTSGSITRLFDDPFAAPLDTTNKWTLTGTTLPVTSGTN